MKRYAWRVLGLVGGWSLAGPAGGLFGFLCGLLVDQFAISHGRARRLDRFLSEPEREREASILVPWGVASLLTAVATADGPAQVSQIDMATVAEWPSARSRRVTARGERPSDRRAMLDQMLTARVHPDPARVASVLIPVLSSRDIAPLVELLVRVAAADRTGVTQAERRLIRRIAGTLGYPGSVGALEQQYGGLDRDSCAILGVAPTATASEVRRVYRRLAADLHPDTAGALDDAQREDLGGALIRIRTAYEVLSAQLSAREAEQARETGHDRTDRPAREA